MTLPAGRAIPTLKPGSPEWMQNMSASKVAAMLGLSPWESRFSLWHRMAGNVPADPGNDQTRRGHYLEAAVCQWFDDQHPELVMTSGGCWAHHHNTRFTASPDMLLWPEDGPGDRPSALLEAKTSATSEEWGQPGTDEIPPYYRAQIVWQMDVVGVERCHVAVLLPYLTFAEYVVEYDPDEAAYLRAEAAAFLDTLPGGPNEQAPDLDAHTATYQAVRQMHPDVEDREVELPFTVAADFAHARYILSVAEDKCRRATTRLADVMGDAARATYAGQVIARRQAKNGGAPFIVAAKNLPRFDLEDIA